MQDIVFFRFIKKSRIAFECATISKLVATDEKYNVYYKLFDVRPVTDGASVSLVTQYAGRPIQDMVFLVLVQSTLLSLYSDNSNKFLTGKEKYHVCLLS